MSSAECTLGAAEDEATGEHVHKVDPRMTSGYSLPPPHVLEIHDTQASEKWKKFKRAWMSYALATVLDKKLETVQVVTLLTIVGVRITPVLSKVALYCEPHRNLV